MGLRRCLEQNVNTLQNCLRNSILTMLSFVIKLSALWLLAIIGVIALAWLQLPAWIYAPLLLIGAWAFMLAVFRLCIVET